MATPYSHLIGTTRGELLLGTSSSYDDNWSGNDLIEAGDGHDTIRSFNGADTVLGGAGNDLIVTRGPLNNNGEDDWGGIVVLSGGAGDDRIMNQFNGFPDRLVFHRMSGGSGEDLLVLHSMSIGELSGGSGNDRIFLSGQGGVARGGGGDDLVSAVNSDRIGEWYGFNRYDGGASDTLIGGRGNDRIVCYAGNEDTIIFRPGDGRDVVRYLNATPDGDPDGDELPIDRIVLTSFDLDMTAEEFLATRATDLGDRVILRPGAGSDALVIWDVRIDDLADVLIL